MAAAGPAGRGSILIVDDDEDSQYVYRVILENAGFDVIGAMSGDRGLALAQELRPNAILMDVSVPGMDGWRVTQRLKSDSDTRGIPIIIVTAHAFPEDLRRAESVGSDGFLTKPCEPRRVLEEVQRLLEG